MTVSATLPGGTFVAGRTCRSNRTHRDAYVGAHDAIDALRRQLEDFVRAQRDSAVAPGLRR